MAFKTFSPKSAPVSLAVLEESIARRRKASASEVNVPRNSGTRRTASKLALLAEIAKTGKVW